MDRGMAMLLTLLVLASALFAGWYSMRRTHYFPERLATTFPQCAGTAYEHSRWAIQDESDNEWFTGELAGFREPLLYRQPASARRSVRFLLVPDFYDPAVVRIDTLENGSLQLTAKQRPGGAGYPRGGERLNARELTRTLRPDEAQRFEALLARVALFDLPDGGCQRGLHGEQWIVEASDRGVYRYRQFQSPDNGVERDIGLMMLGFTGWEVEPLIRHRPA